MKSPEDRRSPNINRVSLTTLVDICSQEGDASPFQAESANVSGRGMHVRTSYLPEVGEELVCRLNHDDQEVLVEGRVAWRSEGADSGEFGIQFTALDADSADVLQTLGQPISINRRSSPMPSQAMDDDEDDEPQLFSEGSRVKLHIEGLGAPMKACVHQGSSRKLKVGSCLEFLKVGRQLQVEDVGEGQTRGAQVDSVNVVINPTTSVPELVVQLRYEGVSPTPAPVRVEEAKLNFDDEAFSDAPPTAEESEAAGELSDDDAAPWEPAAEALRARLGGAMKSAGSAASRAGGVLGSVAQSARESVVAAAASRGIGGPKAGRTRPQTPGAKRRQTSRLASRAAPAHLRSGIHDLGLAGKHRPSVSRRGAPVAPPPKAKRRVAPAALFGAAFLVFGGTAVAFRALGAEEKAATPAAEAPAAAVAAAPAAKAAQPAAPKKEKPKEGVVAEVPLFGPQAMATKPAETIDEDVDVAEAEKRSAAASMPDQSWEDGGGATQAEQVTPWGKGRLYLPTIHRVRLDGVGASLAGAVNQDGFTVVIPGRKAMESGKSIEKRDKRIIAVKTSNGANGATVKFEFRGAVPPYRVRLRQDFIEFLISAPEDTVARL